MVEMKLEEMILHYSVYGIWAPTIEHSFLDDLYAALCSLPQIRYLAYCLIGEKSFPLASWVASFRSQFPSIRVIVIGNDQWYRTYKNNIQYNIQQIIEQSDYFVHCTFPKEDAFFFLKLCCKYVYNFQSFKR